MPLSIKRIYVDLSLVKRTILKNTIWLFTAEGITNISRFILAVFMARALGPLDYGKFNFANAIVAILIIFANFGLVEIIVRELSQKEEKIYSSLLSLKIFLSVGTFLLIILASFFVTNDILIKKTIWILGGYLVVNSVSELFFSFFRARQQMQYEAMGKIVQSIVVTAVNLWIVFSGPTIYNLGLGYLVASIVGLLFILICFARKIAKISFKIDTNVWKKYLIMAWPLGLVAVSSTIYTFIDSAMMGFWNQTREIGWYNAAYKIANAALVPALLIVQVFYPAMSEAFKRSKQELLKIFDKALQAMFFLAVPITVGGLVLADRIIFLVYGSDFKQAALALQILIVMTGINFIATIFYYLLIVINLQKKAFWIAIFGAVINIVLNIILIPSFSLYGAAASTLVTYLLMLILSLIFAKVTIKNSFFDRKIKWHIFAIICASIGMYIVLRIMISFDFPSLAIILLGGGSYLMLFAIIQSLFRKDQDLIKNND
jgi:O-antigen/teichoic acid export membrane protein